MNEWLIERLLYIKNNPESSKASEYKGQIFNSMKFLVNRNILNYKNLMFKSQITGVEEDGDFISECYIILNNCINKFDFNKGSGFHYYYNKGLLRYFYNLFKSNLEKNSYEIEYSDLTESDYSPNDFSEIEINIIIENYGFNDLCKKVIISKINDETLKTFLENNKDINKYKYNNAIRNIRSAFKEEKLTI